MFLLAHVLVHVLSAILTVSFIAQVGEHAQNNGNNADHFGAIMSLIFLLSGIVAVLGTSLSMSNPFENGIATALVLWCFVASFATLLYSYASISGTIVGDHSSRVLGLFAAMSHALGLCFLFAGLTAGIASAAKEFPNFLRPTVPNDMPLLTKA